MFVCPFCVVVYKCVCVVIRAVNYKRTVIFKQKEIRTNEHNTNVFDIKL